MRKLIVLIGLAGLMAGVACEEIPEPIDPCDDNRWATSTRNGEPICLGQVEVTYFHANSSAAKIIMSARNEGPTMAPEIYVEFSIPVEGITLNTAYPVLEGKIYDADEITEGSLTLLVFDPPSQGKEGCIAGTFTLTAQTGGITTFNYTDGKFVYFKGAGTESSSLSPGCNPFN